MACDVFLIVFRRYDVGALRRLEVKFAVVITALAFIPAFVFVFIHTPDKGYMYGSVTVSGEASRKSMADGLDSVTALVRHRSQLGALSRALLLRPNMACHAPYSRPFFRMVL